MWILLGVILWSSFLSTPCLAQLRENEPCQNGACKRFRDCPWATQAIRQGVRPVICGFSGVNPIICCPDETSSPTTTPVPTETAPPETPRTTVPTQQPLRVKGSVSKIKCSEYAKYVYEIVESPILSSAGELNRSTCAIESQTLIVGGSPAAPKEFPHMALVGYGSDEAKIKWLCGGSLISENFVLSAAHCSNPRRVGPATWVKLGELDLSKDTDDSTPVTIKIAERIDHPAYDTFKVYNDITLFRLETEATLTPYIRPICLHDGRVPPQTAIASGWGNTEFRGKSSDSLQKVRIRLVPHQECSKSYVGSGFQLPDGIRESSQVCAGEPGKDTCQGDSGGPLQITLTEPFCMYMQIGITSFGKGCASQPGVYTRITHYLDWIEKTVWPND